jgi:hypothetical protein
LHDETAATIKTTRQGSKAGRQREGGLIEIVRTNDLVLISVIEILFEGAEIGFFIADRNMSAMEGSLGFMPRRILVDSDDHLRARRLLTEAGLAAELRDA